MGDNSRAEDRNVGGENGRVARRRRGSSNNADSGKVKDCIKERVDYPKVVNNVRQYRCDFCLHCAQDEKSLDDHVNRIHMKTILWSCHLCDYITSTEDSLRWHLDLQHNGVVPYRCHLCDDYSTTRNEDLHRHLDSHLEEDPFKCLVCDYSTKRLGLIEMHLRTHVVERAFKCPRCDYNTFVRNYSNVDNEALLRQKVCDNCTRYYAM